MVPPKVYGLIGYPVKHSFSAVMHNAAFKALGIRAEYRLFEVKPEELKDFLLNDVLIKDIHGEAVFAKDILGFNITIPHKIHAKTILSQAFPYSAPQESTHYMEISGAINTVKRVGDKLKYCNTDAPGFAKSVKQDLRFNSKYTSILLIGCGGAGRAIIASLTWKGAYTKKIYIYENNREAVKAAKSHFSQFPSVSKKLEFIFTEQVPNTLKQCDLLINASPVGMKEADAPVLDKKILAANKELRVYDVVYNRQTELVKAAQELGIPVSGGLGMLFYQGVLSFEFWTGKKAPEEVMRKALDKEMRKCLN